MKKLEKNATKKKSDSPPLLGLSIAVTFLLWGMLTFYMPTYLEIDNSVMFNVIGFAFLIISFVGSLMEISDLWKSEALSYWGVSILFIAPAILLHLSLAYYNIIGYWNIAIKILVIGLFVVGIPFIPIGFAYLTWNKKYKYKEKSALCEEDRGKRTTDRLQLLVSLFVTLLTLATAIVQLVSQMAN